MKTIYTALFISIFLSINLSVFAQKDIVILFTNDAHSRIEPLPQTDRIAPDRGGIVRRHAFINQVRSENRNVLLFDSGDFVQGTPYFNVFRGKVEIEAKNRMQYTAVTPGNHEFGYGIEGLKDMVQWANFPFIASNYDFSQTILAGLIKPYLIIEKEGVRIGVISANIELFGLVASSSHEGVKFLDPIKTANYYAALLRSRHRVDMVICLSHLGIGDDRIFAQQTRNIDIILGGHSHFHMDEPEMLRNLDGEPVMLLHTSGRGVNVGRIDVRLERN